MNTSTKRWFYAAAGAVLIFGAIVALSIHFDVRSQFVQLLNWLDEIGIWGPIILTMIYALIVLLALPGVAFTMGAGFLFGLWVGSVCVVAGSIIGATGAFFLAKYALRARAERLLNKHPRLKVVNEYVAEEAWKVVLLTRMIPFFPFKLSNYVYGSTGMSYWDFFVGTLIGIIPITLTSVYAGSLASDLASLGARRLDRTPLEWAVYGLGLAVLLVFVTVIGREAHRRLKLYRETEGPRGRM